MPKRLEFPEGEGPLGRLEVSGLTGDQPLPAQGVIEVPDDASVSLTIDRRIDLRGLSALASDALMILRLDHPDYADEDLAHIAHLTGLSRLILVNTAVGDDGLGPIGQIEGLKRLFLDGTRVTDRGMAALKSTRLERLSLNNTEIGDDALTPIARIPTLTHLMVANTRVSDRGLAALAGMAGLALVDVSESDVSGEGLLHLPRSLALVVFCEGPKVNDEEIERVRRERPDLVLNGVRHWTPPSEALS